MHHFIAEIFDKFMFNYNNINLFAKINYPYHYLHIAVGRRGRTST